jgi:hypothetical protein
VPGLLRWKCIAADGLLTCSAREFEPTERAVSALDLESHRPLRIELLRATRILVELRDKQTGDVVPWRGNADHDPSLVAERVVAGVHESTWTGRIVAGPGFRVPRGGTYVVRVAKPPAGFQPTHPQRVTVREHEAVTVTFDLVRY